MIPSHFSELDDSADSDVLDDHVLGITNFKTFFFGKKNPKTSQLLCVIIRLSNVEPNKILTTQKRSRRVEFFESSHSQFYFYFHELLRRV